MVASMLSNLKQVPASIRFKLFRRKLSLLKDTSGEEQ